MRLSLPKSIRSLPLIASCVFILVAVGVGHYLMQDQTARMWHHPDPNKRSVKDWADRWYAGSAKCKVVAGCDCCAGVYEVRGSRLAILLFPRVIDDGIDWKSDGWVLPGRE